LRFGLDHDVVCGLDPFERMAVFVPGVEEALDCSRSACTLLNAPRRTARAVSRENHVSTWFIQLPLVGVKWK
jgi:hypothetical protein